MVGRGVLLLSYVRARFCVLFDVFDGGCLHNVRMPRTDNIIVDTFSIRCLDIAVLYAVSVFI